MRGLLTRTIYCPQRKLSLIGIHVYKTAKFVKFFSLESFPPYDVILLYVPWTIPAMVTDVSAILVATITCQMRVCGVCIKITGKT